jgi:hypothetical protein
MKSEKIGAKNVFKYAWKTKKWIIIFAFFLLLISVPILIFIKENGGINNEWNVFDPVISVLTLIVAVIIWISELYQEAQKNLPKRFTVIFKHNDIQVMICNEAYLSGENDIRAWGQQIGRQMSKNQSLDFNPDIQQTQTEIRTIIENKKKIKVNHYTVTFQLRELSPYLKYLCERSAEYPLIVWPPFEYPTIDSTAVLLGNTFPLSLIRRNVSIQYKSIDNLKEIIRSRKIVSFWGHENSADAASELLGFNVKPKTERPALELNQYGLPVFESEIFDECWILSPNLPQGMRPGLSEIVPFEQIKGWSVLKITWEQ